MKYILDYISPEMQAILLPAIDNSHFSRKCLSYREYQNGYIMPFYKWRESIGGIAESNKIAVIDSRNIEWAESFEPFENIQPVIKHERVIYLGVLLAGYGHTFTDDLRKLWFLQTDTCKNLLKTGAKVVYTTDINQELPTFAKEIIQYAGVDIAQTEHVTKLTQYDTIILPDNSFYAETYGRCYTQEYVNCINLIKQNIATQNCKIVVPEKIYLSRSKFSKLPWSKQEQGEDIIEREMNKNGFVSITPEDYSFAEQIYLVQHCKVLATTEGSIAHTTIFCQPNTKVILFCKARYLNFHQVAINQFADLDITYIEAHKSYKISQDIPWCGPFYLCITKYFEAYLGYNIPHIPYYLRPSFSIYMRYIPRLFNKVFHLLKIRKRL